METSLKQQTQSLSLPLSSSISHFHDPSLEVGEMGLGLETRTRKAKTANRLFRFSRKRCQEEAMSLQTYIRKSQRKKKNKKQNKTRREETRLAHHGDRKIGY